MSKNKFYKVAFREGGREYSAVAYGVPRVEYKIGEFVGAPSWLADRGYHLSVFSCMESAERFFNNETRNDEFLKNSLHIFECEVEEITEKLPALLEINCLSESRMIPDRYINAWPSGTVMAKRVKLICEVRL